MRKCKRILSLSLVLLLSLSVQALAAVSLPSISSNKPISCYTLNSSGKVYAYKDSNLRTKTGGYIDCSTDECKIQKISGNAVQVKYPVKGGTRTAWFARSAFTSYDLANGTAEKWEQKSQVTTYKRSDGKETYGYISKGDICYKLSETGNYKQVIYPVSSGYKIGWIKTNETSQTQTNGNNIVIGNVTLDYALGDYFTDNGKACTKCHNGHSGNYATNERYCNCKCTATIGNRTYKLGSIQCFGFARYVQSALYGTNSHLSSKSFTRTGSVSKSKLTTSKLKSMIKAAGVGAHIRTGASAHSMIITEVTENGFTVIQCNGTNNDNYKSYAKCRIGAKTYTWESYKNSTYGKRGIDYIETYAF